MHKKNMQSNQEIKELSIQCLFENKHYMNKLFYFILGFIVFFNLACEKKQVEPPQKKSQSYDYETIYKHVSQVLAVNKKKSLYVKWNKDIPISYQFFGLHDAILENKLEERIEEIKKITGLKMHRKKANEKFQLGFIFVGKDVTSEIQNSNLFDEIAIFYKENPETFKQDLIDSFTKFDVFIKERRLAAKDYDTHLFHIRANMIIAYPTLKTIKYFETLFLRMVFSSVLDGYSGFVIKDTLTYPRPGNNLLNYLSKFDKAFLKAVYSNEVLHGMKRKEASKIIAKKIYETLENK